MGDPTGTSQPDAGDPETAAPQEENKRKYSLLRVTRKQITDPFYLFADYWSLARHIGRLLRNGLQRPNTESAASPPPAITPSLRETVVRYLLWPLAGWQISGLSAAIPPWGWTLRILWAAAALIWAVALLRGNRPNMIDWGLIAGSAAAAMLL